MKSIFALFFCFFAVAVSAQELAPDAQVKKITGQVIAIAKQDKNIRAGDQSRLNALIDAEVLPHFDFSRMTALAVGRNWRKASPEQQAALTSEFRALLVRTYSSALSSYRNQVIEFKPLRVAAEDDDVTVRTQVRQPGAVPISIDYSMQKTASGWKVYDVVVGGISLVTNYRETFIAEIRNGGVDGLIKTLASKNHSQEVGAGAQPG
ncbi:MAG: ABC transporter substrate-binding protein [Burkholderiales bacterium]|nr:ABC transporter substrate-binding protein [Burkholderiales bacterium]